MHFEHTAAIRADKAEVWDFLMDIPRVGRCVPGVQEVEAIDQDRYKGTLRIKVGPISLLLQGTIRMTEQDPAAGRAVMRAQAADRKMGGSVEATLGLFVMEPEPGVSQLTIHTDADVLGRIGEFGQPIIRKKTEQLMAEFVENLRQQLTTTPSQTS